MKRIIFWFGIYDLIAGTTMYFPQLWEPLGVVFPEPAVWSQFIAILIIYWGLVSVWSSRNLRARATIMYWQCLIRMVSPILFGYWVIFGGMAAVLAGIGIFDLIFGLVVIFGLPKMLGTTHAELFRDAV